MSLYNNLTTYVCPDAPQVLNRVKDLILWYHIKHVSSRSLANVMGRTLAYLQWCVAYCSTDFLCVLDAFRLILWWNVCGCGKNLGDVVLREEALEYVEFPGRDGIVKLPHGVELRGRLFGEGHRCGGFERWREGVPVCLFIYPAEVKHGSRVGAACVSCTYLTEWV